MRITLSQLLAVAARLTATNIPCFPLLFPALLGAVSLGMQVSNQVLHNCGGHGVQPCRRLVVHDDLREGAARQASEDAGWR